MSPQRLSSYAPMMQHESLHGTYDLNFVVLSIAIASIAAYVALTLAERVTGSHGRRRYWWLTGGATAMGGGIWAMHFTGMLAYRMPIAVTYDVPIVGLSLFAAIVASGIALFVVSRPAMSRQTWIAGGTLMGCAIAAMHYIGMAAMRMSATTRWNPAILLLSLLVAVVVCLIALALVFRLRSVSPHGFDIRRFGAAGVMGFAVAGMHYTGMAAASFQPRFEPTPSGFLIGQDAIGGSAMFVAAALVLVFVIVVAVIDRHLSDQRRSIAQSQHYLQTIVANAPVVLIALDRYGNVMLAEGSELSALGHSAQAMIGRQFVDLYSDVPALVEQARRALAGESYAADATVRDIILDMRWTAVVDSAGALTSVIAVATDITQRREAETALRYRSLHDPLTGLPNRTSFRERLGAIVETARECNEEFALALIDLDRFKEVNDTLGHQVGDVLLRSVADRIGVALADLGLSDNAVRLGGDEFAVLLPRADEQRAGAIAEALLSAFELPHIVCDYTLDVGASLGLAMFPKHAVDEQTLLRCADVAMYVAKRGRLGYVFYDAAIDRHSRDLLALEADMRHAIVDGGFHLHYQPQADLLSGQISAVEALIRWQHPTRGALPPDRFIPLAEETGLIVPLTRWVLEEAIRQIGAWTADGISLTVAVNVSMRNLRETTFPDTVTQLLAKYGVPAEKLVIEVTETVIMTDDERTRDVFARLAALGIVLSIDDFGTGYSSLAYLKQLPVAELKIDKSFVLELAQTGSKDSELIGLIANLGHNLGLRVVAEGVESEAILIILAALGCDIAQGYFISRPMPAADLPGWFFSARLHNEIAKPLALR